MRISSSLLPVLGALTILFPSARAQEAPTAPTAPTALELRELRQAVQQQSKQIESLAQQIGRLSRALDAQKNLEAAAPTVSFEAPKPVPEAPKAEIIPKAEAVPGGVRHIVVKGETLTSIAKQYNIPIADLKNANKIENERKLQIGQVLSVPPANPPETPDKKENP